MLLNTSSADQQYTILRASKHMTIISRTMIRSRNGGFVYPEEIFEFVWIMRRASASWMAVVPFGNMNIQYDVVEVLSVIIYSINKIQYVNILVNKSALNQESLYRQ
jgi:hypothetical protein